MPPTTAAIVYSVIAALFVAVGSALQHQGVGDTESSKGGVTLVMRLLRNKRWMAGMVIANLSTVMHAAALKDGTLAVVEPVMAVNLAMALPVRALLDRERPSAGQSIAALVLTGGVALFVVTSNPTQGMANPNGTGAFFMLAGSVLLALVCIAIASRTTRERVAGVTLGLAGGVLYGVAGGVLKTATTQVLHNPVGALFDWPLWALIGLNVWAFIIHQEAYARAPLRASLPALSVSNPIASIIFGSLVFDEIIRHTPLDIAGEVLGLAIIIGAVLALAQRDPGRHRTQPSFIEGISIAAARSAVGNRRAAAGTRRAVSPRKVAAAASAAAASFAAPVAATRSGAGSRRAPAGSRRGRVKTAAGRKIGHSHRGASSRSAQEPAPAWQPQQYPSGYAAAPVNSFAPAPVHGFQAAPVNDPGRQLRGPQQGL